MNLLNKIYLIGMPGSGKSTLGRQLAEKLNRTYIDLDQEIEKREGVTIPELFKVKGETYFRKIEHELLSQLTEKNEIFVMATGGGAPCYHKGIDLMLKNGSVIYIHVPIKELVARLGKNVSTRPKFNTDNEVEPQMEALASQRNPVYQQAQITVSGDQISVEDLVDQLIPG